MTMPKTLRTERGDIKFRAKEGINNVWIDAEPQSETGKMIDGISALGFTLYTNNIDEAERIAEFLNQNISQVAVTIGRWSE